jgi:hypothetical protein
VEHDGDPAGQHRTVGATLIAMGTVFSGLAVYLMVAEADLPFISPRAMLYTCMIFIAVGIWQWFSARQFD